MGLTEWQTETKIGMRSRNDPVEWSSKKDVYILQIFDLGKFPGDTVFEKVVNY